MDLISSRHLLRTTRQNAGRSDHGEWIQYGNGKNPRFVISWDYAKTWVQTAFEKNELPLGIGGEKLLKTAASPQDEERPALSYICPLIVFNLLIFP